MSSSNKLIR